jgi:hypothetical protein
MTSTPKSYEVTIQVSARAFYKLTLTNKAAKTICAEMIDPDDPWANQAHSLIEEAIQMDLEDVIFEKIAESMPTEIKAEMQGIAVNLKSEDSAEVEIDAVEVA